MLEALGQAIQPFGDPIIWLLILLGGTIGLVFGVIPGIGGMTALALLLPFLFGRPPEQALVLVMALAPVSSTGGAISAILLNVPGIGPNAATLIDGYPMTVKGEGGRALGAALASSGMGGALSGFLALAIIPLVLPMTMAIRFADMVIVILVGLAFIGILGGASKIKGLISGGLGLLISLIGFQAMTGVARFTFGSPYLYDGMPLVPLTLGLFAIPEMVALATRGGTIAKATIVSQGMADVWKGVRDVFHHWGLWLRSSIIGYIIGIIPGVGADAASFITYGQAKQLSKHPELFGTGIVEGVIAPESANNGKEGGALIVTLALGIPGSAHYALVLAAILMLGLSPGPEMLRTHLPLSLTLILVIIVTNIIAAVVCLFLAPRMAKIAFVPSAVLIPLVISIVLVGSYVYSEFFSNIIVTLIFSTVGIAMKQFGYSRPALLLGYILGFLFERHFFFAIQIGGPLFFIRPISLTLIFLLVALFAYRPVKNMIQNRRRRAAG